LSNTILIDSPSLPCFKQAFVIIQSVGADKY
jgi:hypothetical protein